MKNFILLLSFINLAAATDHPEVPADTHQPLAHALDLSERSLQDICAIVKRKLNAKNIFLDGPITILKANGANLYQAQASANGKMVTTTHLPAVIADSSSNEPI